MCACSSWILFFRKSVEKRKKSSGSNLTCLCFVTLQLVCFLPYLNTKAKRRRTMLASTSTSSTSLVTTCTSEGVKHLYRTILQQARLLASTLDDPIVLSSHRHLARKNLEPLLCHHGTVETIPPASGAAKRISRAQLHRRHLADANFGWEHSVQRALEQAYARRGKLRRDALSDLSPTPSSAKAEQKYPKRLRKKDFPRVLQVLLTSGASMNGAAVKSREHLVRPPPPFLPAVDDPLVRMFGKAQGRPRVANARNRFVRAYMRKISIPFLADDELVRGLERKSRRLDPSAEQEQDAQPRLNGARSNVDIYRSALESSVHRKRALRTQGWTSHPKDFSRPRRRRRLYAKLLDDIPLLLADSTCRDEGSKRRKNDPLGIRSTLNSVGEAKLKVVKSSLAVGPKSRGVEVAPRTHEGQSVEQRLDASEVHFLRNLGWL